MYFIILISNKTGIKILKIITIQKFPKISDAIEKWPNFNYRIIALIF